MFEGLSASLTLKGTKGERVNNIKNIMQEAQRELKADSEPPALNDPMSSSNVLTVSSKAGQILRIESQIRKLKQVVTMQNELRKNKEQFNQINQQIIQFEERVKLQRRQAFKDKMVEIQRRRYQRQSNNQETNQVLAKIKEGHRQRRKKMESVVNLYREQYEHVYNKSLSRKREQMRLDIGEIKVHESQYLKNIEKRRSYRVKTEKSNNNKLQGSQSKHRIDRSVNHRYSPSANSHDIALEQRKQLIQRRKEYGENAEKEALKVKISLDMIRKGKPQKNNAGYDQNIDYYENMKKKMEKPRLNTNFYGNIELQQSKELNKLAQGGDPMKEKMTRLKNLAEGMMVRYDNGHDSALDKMSSINLVRAQLLLEQS